MARDTSSSPREQADCRDSFFVPERRPRASALQKLCVSVGGELTAWEESHGVRKRKRRRADQSKHDQMVEAVLCNALHCHLKTPDTAVAVSLGRQRGSRYEPPPYAPMLSLLTALGETASASSMWRRGHARSTDAAVGPLSSLHSSSSCGLVVSASRTLGAAPAASRLS